MRGRRDLSASALSGTTLVGSFGATPHPTPSRGPPSPARGEGSRLASCSSSPSPSPPAASHRSTPPPASPAASPPSRSKPPTAGSPFSCARISTTRSATIEASRRSIGWSSPSSSAGIPRGLRLDNVAERYAISVTVGYTLTDLATGKTIHTGEVTSEVSYDSVDAPYAGIAARQDSQERVASDAARRIQVELAAWMARNKAG